VAVLRALVPPDSGRDSAGYEFVVTGAVLLLAAGFDSVVRRSRAG